MDKWVFFQSSSFKVERVGDGIRFKVKIQPKSSRSEVVGIQSDYLKIKVSSPPTRVGLRYGRRYFNGNEAFLDGMGSAESP